MLLQFASHRLTGLTAELWGVAIRDRSSQELRLLLALKTLGVQLQLGEPFVAALSVAATDVLKAELDPATVSKRWPLVVDALPQSLEPVLRRELVSRVAGESMTPETATKFVKAFRSAALGLRFSTSKERASEALTGFFWHLRHSGDPEVVSFLEQMLDDIERCRKKAPKEDVKAFDEAAE